MANLAPQVSATGIVAPDYENIYQQLRILYWTIYGADANLDPDSLDGQFLAVLARAINDNNDAIIAIFNSFRPSFAQGAGLSSIVKINGIRRLVPTKSTATIRIVGQIGTVITNGIVGDNLNLNTQWALPATVTIPGAGQIDVTATCTVFGAVAAAANSLTRILTPTRGWQTANNAAAATLGAPVETDAALRIRQTNSTALPAQAIVDGIYAAVANLTGVTRLKLYENDSDATDGNGVPAHSISLVVQGGDSTEIAESIANKKPPGCGTYGTTSVVVEDEHDIENTINFFRVAVIQLKVEVSIQSVSGYTAVIGDQIKQAVVDFIAGYQIGEISYTTRLYVPASLGGVGDGATFVVTNIRQAIVGNAFGTANVAITFNQVAALDLDQVTLVVT